MSDKAAKNLGLDIDDLCTTKIKTIDGYTVVLYSEGEMSPEDISSLQSLTIDQLEKILQNKGMNKHSIN